MKLVAKDIIICI